MTEDLYAAARAAHLATARRALHRHSGDCVLSHETAAIGHRLPTYRLPPKAQLTRDDGSRRTTGRTDVTVAGLPRDQVVLLEGVRATSMARTVVDVGRTPLLEALVTADAALRRGTTPGQLSAVLATMPRWPGARAAQRVVRWADGRSESPCESVVRGRFVQLGIPMPELQVWIDTGQGSCRVDFCWEAVGLVGEADGRVKYGGADGEQVLWGEKQRRDALEEERTVIRWTWKQAHASDDEFRARLARAWTRAARFLL